MLQVNDAAELIINQESWSTLVEINDMINIQVQYKTDLEIYKKNDFWDIVEKEGDCDDYALTKRSYLRQAGVPTSCMALATCWVETGEYHAVLTVDTDKGTFVLDNRYANVMHFKDLPYKWHYRQAPGQRYWNPISS